jgi:hypothetical protein
LCRLQRILQFSTVEGPPFPRGTTWSISSIAVAPQMPPSCVGHGHLPPSRARTSRFTFAGTEAFRFSCFSTSSSSAAVRTCSSVAFGCTWLCPAFAFFRSAKNFGETVMWIRVSVDVIGSTMVLGCAATAAATDSPLSGWVRSRPTGWTMAAADSTGADSIGAWSGTSVTTVLARVLARRSCAGCGAPTCLPDARRAQQRDPRSSPSTDCQ